MAYHTGINPGISWRKVPWFQNTTFFPPESNPIQSTLSNGKNSAWIPISPSILPLSKADPLDSALDLMRRLPPEKVQQNLSKLIDIVPDLTEDLLAAVDQPLKVDNCKKTGKSYLLCDYNRDADSFRCVCVLWEPGIAPFSSWSDPRGQMTINHRWTMGQNLRIHWESWKLWPMMRLILIEKCMDHWLATCWLICWFRYFEGGVSSVYMWDLDDGFAAAILIKKSRLCTLCVCIILIQLM